MQPNISEFSYGYAITDELIHHHGLGITAAPIFPSLVAEGRTGGGWDVKLQRPGIPLFLQFKLSHYMSRWSAYECQQRWFQPPFYRMHLRPKRFSEQHEMLLDLEIAGNEVYYSAPAFHEPWELDHAYLSHQVKYRSIWIRPSWIGPLPDNRDHHVAFQHPGARRFCSDSKPIEEDSDFSTFYKRVFLKVKSTGQKALSDDSLSTLAKQIMGISAKRSDIPSDIFETTRMSLSNRSPLEQIAFFSSMFLGAQLFIVSENE